MERTDMQVKDQAIKEAMLAAAMQKNSAGAAVLNGDDFVCFAACGHWMKCKS